jgi:hypothetical protein
MQALVETTQKVLTGPSAFFASMPVTGGIGGPLLYAIVVGSLGVIVAAIYREVFSAQMPSPLVGMGAESALARVMPVFTGGVSLLLEVVFAPLLVTVGLFLVSAVVHLVLSLVGGARQGFEATFRVMCYSEAAAVINVIPFCGSPLAAIYFMVLAVIGLAAAHGIGTGKAAVAVVLPIVLLCCCCATGAIMMISGLAAFLSQVKI